MAGNGEGLTPKQEQAISALLAQPSIDRAAAACKVNERTLRRWLREPAFLAEYRAARKQIVEMSLALLQRVTGLAVEALVRNLSSGKASSEVASALGILDRAVKAVELVDLVERVEELERRAQTQKDGGEVR
jgi:hypothetical protein